MIRWHFSGLVMFLIIFGLSNANRFVPPFLKIQSLKEASSQSSISKILFLTDIHLDILYNSETSSNYDSMNIKCKKSEDYFKNNVLPFDYGRYNCNPSIILLESALEDISQKFPDLQLIILGGDLISHGIMDLKFDDSGSLQKNKEIFDKTFETVVGLIRQKLPKVKILPIAGNNDFYEHYQTPDEESKNHQMVKIKSLFFGPDSDFSNFNDFNYNFNETFLKGMYYSYHEPKLDISFISINTNIFSSNNLKESESDAEDQLLFIESELKKLKMDGNKKAFVMMHIPPYPMYVRGSNSFFYYKKYTQRLEQLMFEYRDVIINTFAGHLHWGKVGVKSKKLEREVPLLNLRVKSPPMVLQQDVNFFSVINFNGLTPIHYSNPAYSIINFNTIEKRITEIEIHFADLQKTLNPDKNFEFSKNLEIQPGMLFNNVFSFNTDFKFQKFDNDDFHDFVSRRIEDSAMFKKFQLYIAGYPKEISQENFNKFIELLKRRKMMDFENNFSQYKCSLKVLYEEELVNC